MSGGGGDRNDFYDYHDIDTAAAGSDDFIEGEVSGFAYQKPMDNNGKHLNHIQQQPQHSIPMNPYLAINHEIEDFKHQNTEGRRTLHKGIN